MPDVYTTTHDPLRPMVCSNCGGDFAGTSANIVDHPSGRLTLCDNCLRALRG